MNLYTIERIVYGYDETGEVAVIAEDAKRARQFVSEQKPHGDQDNSEWLDSKKSKIKNWGCIRATKEAIVMIDFNAG